MDRVSRKVTSIALAAVLCFWMAFPVSAFVKPERAEANPAIALLNIFGTALAAGGVYVAGASMTQYNANLQSVYDGFQQATAQWSQSWSDYVSAQGSFENAMNSCVTEQGNIRLQTLTDAGFFDTLHNYSVYCVDNGLAVQANSSAIGKEVFLVGDVPVFRASAYPYGALVSEVLSQYEVDGLRWVAYRNGGTATIGNKRYSPAIMVYLAYTYDLPVTVKSDNQIVLSLPSGNTRCKTVYIGFNSSNGAVTSVGNHSTGYADSLTIPAGSTDNVTGKREYVINSQVNLQAGGFDTSTGYDTGGKLAGVEQGTYAGTPSVSNADVRPFQPTAEQLASGYDSSAVIEAINGGTAETSAGIQEVISTLTGTIGGVLNDIKTGVNGLESAIGTAISTGATSVINGVSSAINTGVNTLSTVLNDIKSASQTIEQTLGGAISTTLTGIATGIAGVGTTLGDIWGDLQGWYTDWLAWVGTTPLGALIAQVIAALNAGVLDLSGLLELVNAGVLDLSTAIELVQTAVQDGVAEITGAIEGIQFPSFEWPKVEGSPQVALPPEDMRSSMDAVIQDKAPFAYMYTFGEGIQSLEYSSEPKFRMRHTFDIVADEVEIDINAEPWLNRDLGGVTIAQLLRASVTLTLCMGLLYGAYKTAMAAVKAG